MKKGRFEVDALTEVAREIHDRRAVSFVEETADREGASIVGELRLVAIEPPESRLQSPSGTRTRAAATVPAHVTPSSSSVEASPRPVALARRARRVCGLARA